MMNSAMPRGRRRPYLFPRSCQFVFARQPLSHPLRDATNQGALPLRSRHSVDVLQHRFGPVPSPAPHRSSQTTNDPPRSLSSMGSSPRQRPGFLRDVTNTPAFFLAHSPSIPQEDALLSPSLPFIAPDAPDPAKHLVARTARKKRFRARPWANSQSLWLALYFTFNLCLTLYNKGVLVRFPYPYTLTAVHALFGSIGGYLLKERGAYIPARLTSKGYAVLAAFSVLYSANIAVSNLSLQLVTIPVSVEG